MQTSTRIFLAKATLLFFLMFIIGSSSSLAQNDIWVQKSDLGYDAANLPEPSARYGAVGFSINSKGYLGTGYANGYKKDFWEYDPALNIWTQKADFGGTARSGAVGFCIGSNGYVGMGGSYKKDFWEYDPALNSWTEKADFGGTARDLATGFSIGNKGYIGTGNSSNGATKDFWEYDPVANTWTQKADFGGTNRSSAVGFSFADKGYIGTGSSYDGTTHYYKDFWEYNPTMNTWIQKADFGGTARSSAVGFSIGNRGYIGTGYSSSSYTKDFWEYDPALNTWMQKADFGGPARSSAVGFSIANNGYMGTGLGQFFAYKEDLWEYDSAVDSWSQKANFGGTARSSAVGFSIGNKGYMGTGLDQFSAYKKDFWEYDSVSNTWTQKADFGGSHRAGAVGFSIGSKGYLGTGYSYEEAFQNYKDFWEYDPGLNTWTQKTDFVGHSRDNAYSFTIGNKGYIGAGHYYQDYYAYNHYLNDFWEYDPITNLWTNKADGAYGEGATGFSIGNKGFVGTGSDYLGYNNDTYFFDYFSEYDPVTDAWTAKAPFAGGERAFATSFSIGGKGYIGTGHNNEGSYNDFWEYDPATDVWTKKADFVGTARHRAVGFNIGSKGYIGTGYSSNVYAKDFWEYNPETTVTNCPCPSTLSAVNLTSTTANLKWLAINEALSYKVRYKIASTSEWKITKSIENHKSLNSLSLGTEYVWQVKSFCDIQPVVASEWSEEQFFTTEDFRLSDRTIDETMFELYPNPFSQSATVTFFLTEESNVTIELMDVNGRSLRVIAEKDFSSGTHEVIFNRELLVAGIYFLQLKTNVEVMMKKIVVE